LRNWCISLNSYIQTFLLCSLGISLSLLPLALVRLLVYLLALLAIFFLPKRKKLTRENLRSAYTNFSEKQLGSLVFVAFERAIEQGFLVVVWPFLSRKRIFKSFCLSKSNKSNLLPSDSIRSTLWLIPHFCHADTLSILPSYSSLLPDVFALYRPLRNKAINKFVKNSRERFGVKTIDRKDGGMLKTLKVLKRGETLAMLFDQNAGGAGTRLSFMGRECSCTTLPDILNEKYKPRILFVYTRRIGFWRSCIEVEEMEPLIGGQLVIEKANAWLEAKLRSDKQLRESWLWMHQRWKPGAGQPREGRIR